MLYNDPKIHIEGRHNCFADVDHLSQVIDGDPFSRYLIICTYINNSDTWAWKYCFHESNFTPVWSNEYGDCSIGPEDVQRAMQLSNDWVTLVSNSRGEQPPALYLMKTHTLKPWEDSRKLVSTNNATGVLE